MLEMAQGIYDSESLYHTFMRMMIEWFGLRSGMQVDTDFSSQAKVVYSSPDDSLMMPDPYCVESIIA